jgi:hypothetical protein
VNNEYNFKKRDDKPNVALNYLQKALSIEQYSLKDSSLMANTHLNICAIHSYVKKYFILNKQFILLILPKSHEEAIKHAYLAI